MDSYLVVKKRPEMDSIGGATGFRILNTPSSSDRFLRVSTHSQPETSVSGGGVGDELSEDEVLWAGDYHNHSANSPSTSSSRSHHHHRNGTGREESFGILAALPVTKSDQTDCQTRSVFNHKASVSSSRMIPKKPPLDRQSLLKYHQSAPVNVPVMTEAMRRTSEMRKFDDIAADIDGEVDGEMLRPHEVVASRQSPMVAYSVLEGVGRTLKGRDLRQVRNAVWRQTGFLD